MLANAPADVRELPNRYSDLETAYHLGYTEGAFGDHSPAPPPALAGERQSVWQDAFGEGQERHEIYKHGFRDGVDAVLTNAGSSKIPDDLSPDQAEAWQGGQAAGMAWAESTLKASGNDEAPGGRSTRTDESKRQTRDDEQAVGHGDASKRQNTQVEPLPSETITDADIPPEEPSPFHNPYTERAHAYLAGYLSGAFGVSSADTWAESGVADEWNEGRVDGYARLKAYKTGFRDGVETKLAKVGPSATPVGLPSDQAEAWRLGQSAGMAKADAVAAQIRSKSMSLPGYGISEQPIGSVRRDFGWAYWQEFGSDRCIYLEAHESPTDDTISYRTYAIGPEIYPKYRELGHWDGFLGPPVADTTIVGDGSGWCGKFRDGEMYWTRTAGAHALTGKILKHWKSLGGTSSYLRYPTSSTSRLEIDRGTATTFQGGDIYLWDDAQVPVDLAGVRITYTGMICFGDTDEAMADEPYPIFTLLTPKRRLEGGRLIQEQGRSVVGPEESAVGGGSYPRNMVLYEGAVANIGAIAVLLMEHDEGDKNAYRSQVETAVQSVLGMATGLATAAAGPAVGVLVGWLAQTGAPMIISAINSALGTDDEVIGNHVHTLSPRRLIDMANAGPRHEQDIAAFKFGHEVLLSGHDASYKVYFNVTIL